MPLRRDRLTSDVGPAASGSKPGIECTQMPERSGTAAAPSVLTAGAAASPKASGTAAATSVTIEGKYRRCRFMVSSLFIGCRSQFADKATASACMLEEGLATSAAFHAGLNLDFCAGI